MSPSVQLQNPANSPLDESLLVEAAQTALAQAGAPSRAGLSIIIADSETVRDYNRRHRNIDAATDVLSFAAAGLPEAIDAEPVYLGDIIIAYDYVAAQCGARGCCLTDALRLLVVHGALHLLGHDHDSVIARENMWRAQAASLQTLGISPALVREYADG